MTVLNAVNLGLTRTFVASSAVASFSYLLRIDLLASLMWHRPLGGREAMRIVER